MSRCRPRHVEPPREPQARPLPTIREQLIAAGLLKPRAARAIETEEPAKRPRAGAKVQP